MPTSASRDLSSPDCLGFIGTIPGICHGSCSAHPAYLQHANWFPTRSAVGFRLNGTIPYSNPLERPTWCLEGAHFTKIHSIPLQCGVQVWFQSLPFDEVSADSK